MDREPSVFTKIIRGDIPSHKVYEDDATYAFMNIHPSQPGHVLVVPKVQVDRFEDLDEDTYVKLMLTVRKLARHMREVTGKRITLKIAGYDVPHAHVHLVPAANADEFWTRENQDSEPDHEALAAMAEKLKLES